MLYFALLYPLWNIWNAREWREVPCTIVSGEVKESTNDAPGDGPTYEVRIRYTYEFDGRIFQSDRFNFTPGGSSGYYGKKIVVDQYPAGTQSTCYVNPSKPKEAVLDRGPTRDLWWGLISLPFLAIGSLAFRSARSLEP